MASIDKIFGDVRSILEERPSREGWEALCGHLDLCIDDALEQEVVPYCLDKLKRWPSELRATPKEWCIAAVTEGERSAKFEVATTLRFYCGSTAASWALKGADGGDKVARFLGDYQNIDRVELKGHPLGPQGARQLFLSPDLERVTHLDMRYTQLGDEGARQLAACPHLGAVKTLRLRRAKIKSKGGAALVDAKSLSNLDRFGAGYNKLGKGNWKKIGQSDLLAEDISYLDMGYNNAGQGALDAVLTPSRTASLRFLNIRNCEIDYNDFIRFMGASDFSNLERMNQWSGWGDRPKASVMLEHLRLPRLEYLYLSEPVLDVDGLDNLEALAEAMREHNPAFMGFVIHEEFSKEPLNLFWEQD
jgi:hypothetical protein